jgi:thiamine-phosphate pyrophosphorylase
MGARPGLGAERRARMEAARLYLVCDSSPGGRELPDVLRAAIAGGVDMVQLRDKVLGDDELAAIAHATAALCKRLGTLFVVNDRPAVARDAGADGVHVGQQDMSVAQARELVGADMLLGLSTHSSGEIDAVSAMVIGGVGDGRGDATGDNFVGVDYIGVGPIYATPTKPGRPATGLELVRYAAAHTSLPFVAIGGIHAGNAGPVIGAGARRVAVVRAIAEASDPERAARELRAALDGAHEPSCFRNPAA